MVGSWQQLRSLTLESMPKDYSSTIEDFETLPTQDLSGGRLRLRCLGALAEACPNLEDLTISIVAGQTNHLAGGRSIFHKLHTLRFPSSFLNFLHPGFDESEAALYISSLFVIPHPNISFSTPDLYDFNQDPEEDMDVDPMIIYLNNLGGFYERMENRLASVLATRRRLAYEPKPRDF